MVIPVAWVEFDPEVEIQAANHQLIAAAPEILEALRQLRDFVEDVIPGNGYPTDHPLTVANYAIAKALGESK